MWVQVSPLTATQAGIEPGQAGLKGVCKPVSYQDAFRPGLGASSAGLVAHIGHRTPYIHLPRTHPTSFPRSFGHRKALSRYSGPVHARYVDSYGIGTLTATRPKLRKYIAEVFQTSSIACTGKGVELCMHMRLECLGLNAFHSHRRRGESAETQRNRELCPCCNNSPETPTHFFLECPAYSSPRSLLLAAAIADARAQPIGPGPAATETWRVILANMCPGVIKYVQDCWSIRRAALTGRGANGGHPMALPPVPGLDAAG